LESKICIDREPVCLLKFRVLAIVETIFQSNTIIPCHHCHQLTFFSTTNFFISFRFRPPVEWYRNYSSLRHLLNPISFSIANHVKHCPNKQTTTTTNSSSHSTACTPVVSNQTNHINPNEIKYDESQQGGTTTIPNSFPSREDCRVLILGCGNSVFGEDMIKDGWTGPIAQVDFSHHVMEQMKARYDDAYYEKLVNEKNQRNKHNPSAETSTIPRMEFYCMDVTDEISMMNQFSDSSFDLIICKGVFDAILTCATPTISMQKLVRQCHRMLSSNGTGILFVVTNGNPDSRLEFFECNYDLNFYWSGVNIHSLNNNSKINTSRRQQHQQKSLQKPSSHGNGGIEK
jgi:SAM-dependent methyltransferase